MLDPASTHALVRIGNALASADPADQLGVVHAVLAELGIVPYVVGSGDPWLRLRHGPKELSLRLTREAPSAAFKSLLSSMLSLWLARTVEHDEGYRVHERMDSLSSASFEGLFFHDNGVVLDANQRLSELLGYELDEIVGAQLMARCIAPEDLPRVYELIASGFEGSYVITVIRKDGSRFSAELQVKRGSLGDRPVRIAAIRDVTERERTQVLLRESEQRLRNLAEATFDLTLVSRDGIIVDVAGPLEEVLGYTRDNFVGHHVFDFVWRGEDSKVAERIAERIEGSYEWAGVAANGEVVPFEIVAVQSTLNGAPVRLTAVRDLRPAKRQEAERLKLQQDLERSQRLDSLGVLAGGIAHDFNNLLVGVLGYAELLQARLAEPFDRELLQGILDAGNRAASLTAQMLAYAGQKELGPRTPIDLGELLRELRSLFDAALPKNARVVLSADEACFVLGNRATMTQVLMNLLTNAADALGGQAGTIVASVRRIRLPDDRFAAALGAKVEPGEWVLVEVSDTGCGMKPETEARIFEPFFTTKEQGHGLGLAACLGIVASHGGAMHLETRADEGSTFFVLLPAHAARPEPVARAEAAVPVAVHGPVLVVDDEPMVRTQLRYALRQRGYEIEEAGDGQAALRALEDGADERFSAVVLDVILPDLSGIEVLRRLRERGGRVPVVLASGYHDAALELDPKSFQGFLIKPYSLEQLFGTLERAIAQGRGP